MINQAEMEPRRCSLVVAGLEAAGIAAAQVEGSPESERLIGERTK